MIYSCLGSGHGNLTETTGCKDQKILKRCCLIVFAAATFWGTSIFLDGLLALIAKTLDVFEDADPARKWLKEDAYGSGDVSPLEYAKTEIGAKAVEDLLGRMEYGVFS